MNPHATGGGRRWEIFENRAWRPGNPPEAIPPLKRTHEDIDMTHSAERTVMRAPAYGTSDGATSSRPCKRLRLSPREVAFRRRRAMGGRTREKGPSFSRVENEPPLTPQGWSKASCTGSRPFLACCETSPAADFYPPSLPSPSSLGDPHVHEENLLESSFALRPKGGCDRRKCVEHDAALPASWSSTSPDAAFPSSQHHQGYHADIREYYKERLQRQLALERWKYNKDIQRSSRSFMMDWFGCENYDR